MLEKRPLPQRSRILADQIIGLGSHWYRQSSPLRRIVVEVPEWDHPLVLLTNHLGLGSTTVARRPASKRWPKPRSSQGFSCSRELSPM